MPRRVRKGRGVVNTKNLPFSDPFLTQIPTDRGLKTIRLMTNNPKKVVGLEGYGLESIEQVSIKVKTNPHNARYLKTKREKLGGICCNKSSTHCSLPRP